jgi:hypothetical protein
MEQASKQMGQHDPLDELYWRDEVLQVMYWYRGEGFGETVTTQELQLFLPADEGLLNAQLERMVGEGYLVHAGDGPVPRYAFTDYGAREGARRFADEFAGLTSQGHGECGPDCPHCKGIPRDSCVHCRSA